MKFPVLVNSKIEDYKISRYGGICLGKISSAFLRTLNFTFPVIWTCVQLGFKMFPYDFEPEKVLEMGWLLLGNPGS